MKSVEVDTVFKIKRKNSAEGDNSKSNRNYNFLYVHFFFLYYLFLSSFRFKKVLTHGRETFKIHSWLPQKVLCGIFVSSAILKESRITLGAFTSLKKSNPVSFFKMFAFLIRPIHQFLLFGGLWWKKEKYLRLINFINESPLLHPNPIKLDPNPFLLSVHSLNIVLSFLTWFLGFNVIHASHWSPSWLYRRYVSEVRFIFFLAPKSNFTTAPELSSLTGSDHLLTGVFLFSHLAYRLIHGMTFIYLLIHVWSLWAPATAFANLLYKNLKIFHKPGSPKADLDFNLAFNEFHALKNLSILLTDTIGSLVIPFLGLLLFNYSIHFDAMLLTQDPFDRIIRTSFYASAISVCIFSAEIVRKMEKFKLWLCEECRGSAVDQNKLGILLVDIADMKVGINAAGVFTVNYATLGTLGGLVMTYMVIRLQSQ